ncbi:MAG TPA: GNAT family N-acetyltransferase [Candidatus Dormibacteraeota bacterium]|nr:GNAT family N-acetyltransferase [Candidatus Dormibacteraeota bacterium]
MVERAPSPRLHVVSTSPPPVPEVALAGDLTLRLRPILPSDKDGLHRGFDRLSPTSRYRRFLSPMLRLPPAMVVRFTEIDYVDHFAWVALDARRQVDPGVAVARYIRCADATGTADVAVTVVDEYQGRGVGSLLMRMLCTTARGNGIERFSSLVLSDNHPMVRLLTGLGARFRPDGYGALSFELDLGPTMREIDRRSQPRYGRESA